MSVADDLTAVPALGLQARLILVSGPSGGGKSLWAEHLAAASDRPVVYLATGPLLPHDPDWQQRLDRHRQRRPAHWQTRDVGPDLAPALNALGHEQLALVDSLGTWVSARLQEPSVAWQERTSELLAAIDACRSPVIMVCEEVGWGVVPATAEGHCFRERLTALERHLAQRCDRAWLVVQHRALDLHRLGAPVPDP